MATRFRTAIRLIRISFIRNRGVALKSSIIKRRNGNLLQKFPLCRQYHNTTRSSTYTKKYTNNSHSNSNSSSVNYIIFGVAMFTATAEKNKRKDRKKSRKKSKRKPMAKLRPYAVVTGASQGIGEAIAVNLIQNGWNVCLLARSEDKMLDIIAPYTHQNTDNIVVKCDASKPDEVISACVEINSWCGNNLNLLVNNAGVGIPGMSLETMTLDRWNIDLDVNLRAPMLFTKYLLPALKNAAENPKEIDLEHQNGVYDASVINISSVNATDAIWSLDIAYSCSKAGLDELTKINALELSRYKIRVNSLALGCVPTSILPDEMWQVTIPCHPIGRMGTFEDITAMVNFLSNRKQSGWITGSNIDLNGGWRLIGAGDLINKLAMAQAQQEQE